LPQRPITSRLAPGCAILLLVAFLWSCSTPKAQNAGPPPPTPVSVAVAAAETVPIELRAVGTVEPSVTVQVRSQIAGELMSVHFTEGSDVKQGDLLFEIDKRPYEEALRQAESTLARDTAQVHQYEANLARDRAQAKSTDADAARNTQLAKEGIMSQSAGELARANSDALHESIKADQAAIDSSRAAIESDKSAIDGARLNLNYCEIHAPISGRVGNLLVQQGNLIKVSDVPLVVINKLTPIFVSFGIPQQHLPAIRANASKHPLTVLVSLQGDASKSTRGALTVIDNAVDTTTGTIHLKATFSNDEHLLWPGQFVDVVLTLNTRNATVVPSEAVQAGLRGQMIYVVKPDQSVEARPVTVGQAFGRKVVVEKGIAAGETVVTDGQLRLFPGARVKPVPASKVDSETL